MIVDISKDNYCLGMSDEIKKEQGLFNKSSGFFENQIWRVDDVAEFLKCSVGHVYNLVSKDRIPKRKKG